MKNKRCLLILGVIAMAIILFGCGKQKPIPETTEELGEGGKIDNTDSSAPKAINSKSIVSFDTTFYIEKNDFLEGGYSGFYHFTIKDNVLSEDAQLNLSGKIEQPVLDELQKIIEKNDLVKKNGIDCYTAGVAPEYAPCYFSACYDSGEKLYFREDNDPLAKWAEDVFELFRKAFVEMGYEQLKLYEHQPPETLADTMAETQAETLEAEEIISESNAPDSETIVMNTDADTVRILVTEDADGLSGKGTYHYHFDPVDTRDGKVDYWRIDVYDENGSSFDYRIEAVIDPDSSYIPEAEDLLLERDVNFDGKMDIVVLKGVLGAQAVRYEKAYIRSGEAFEEVIGYDEIPEAMPCALDGKIYGTIRDGAAAYIEVCYEIIGNRVNKLGEIRYEYDEAAEDYVAVN